MKKYISKILPALLSTFVLLASISSCNDDKGAQLELDGGVKITSFKADGIEGIINDAAQTIKLYAPWSYDLTTMTTEVAVSEGATVSPGNEISVNLESTQKYLVLNGNLYNTYVASAEYSKITAFSIGKYKGLINHATGKIIVKYPKGEDVTSLAGNYTTTPGATVDIASGAAQDFTNPVDYTISYMGESFTYEVTVVPTEFKKIAYLGSSESSASIANLDEKAAYNWLIENVPNVSYISFTGIAEGNVDLSEFAVIWWHLDADNGEIPLKARTTSVVNSLESYYQNGGSFFFSSWAVQYAATLGIPLNGENINNMWGTNNSATTTGEPWGLCFTGNENHQIFQYLDKPSGVNNKVYLLSSGVKAKGHNAIWSFDNWTGYPHNIPAWTTATGGINLASFHWDDNLTERSVMFEYPSNAGSGKTICIGAEGYDWYNEDNSHVNTYATNIQILTSNIIGYLSE